MPGLTLDETNAALRQAVEARLAAGILDEGEDCVTTEDLREVRLRGDSLIGCCNEGTTAERTLKKAQAAVRDRHGKYGPPTEHFARTAAMVNAAFGTTFTAADWALVMVLDKVARQLGTEPTEDAAIDIAGYAACHEECRA
jgi:hypothetical protein